MSGKAPGTVPPAAPRLELRIGEEPRHLQVQLRGLLGEESNRAMQEIARRLAARQWRRWRPELVREGASAASFRELVVGYRREIWFWAIGDRSWEQMMEGLRGTLPAAIRRGVDDRAARWDSANLSSPKCPCSSSPSLTERPQQLLSTVRSVVPRSAPRSIR